MLGKLPVPGRPTNLDFSRARHRHLVSNIDSEVVSI